MVRWVQNIAPPSAHTTGRGSVARSRPPPAEVTGSHGSKPRPCSTIREAPKRYSEIISAAMKPRMRYASQEGVIRTGFTTQRSQKK